MSTSPKIDPVETQNGEIWDAISSTKNLVNLLNREFLCVTDDIESFDFLGDVYSLGNPTSATLIDNFFL